MQSFKKGGEELNSYGLWLLLNGIVWLLAILYTNLTMKELTIPLFGVAFYFIWFFLIPLFVKKKAVLLSILCMNTLLATLLFFPYEGDAFNPFYILIISLLIAEGFYRLPMRYSLVVGMVGMLGIATTIAFSNIDNFVQISIGIYTIFLLLALVVYKKTKNQSDGLDIRYQTLLSEYRELKRRVISEEEIARQEERVIIAHEIHDSVGHKLTALLMQLEMFRLMISNEYKENVESLKEIARSSLDETRRAVKSLKASDAGGIPGILRLIRKLESEKIIRVHFSAKHGAFTAHLTGEQSFVIYRSVQEALTNIMKHSQAREAEILFEAPGGSIFRFEISNPTRQQQPFQEGFGLISMRERLQKLGGNLEVYKTDEQFVVTGFIKLDKGD